MPLDVKDIAGLRTDYPGVPDDYLEFLGSTGHGMFGSLTIYNGLVEPTFIFGNSERHLDSRYRAFADFNGDVIAAFDLKSWAVVEMDESRSINVTDETFSTFIDRWLTIIEG